MCRLLISLCQSECRKRRKIHYSRRQQHTHKHTYTRLRTVCSSCFFICVFVLSKSMSLQQPLPLGSQDALSLALFVLLVCVAAAAHTHTVAGTHANTQSAWRSVESLYGNIKNAVSQYYSGNISSLKLKPSTTVRSTLFTQNFPFTHTLSCTKKILYQFILSTHVMRCSKSIKEFHDHSSTLTTFSDSR